MYRSFTAKAVMGCFSRGPSDFGPRIVVLRNFSHHQTHSVSLWQLRPVNMFLQCSLKTVKKTNGSHSLGYVSSPLPPSTRPHNLCHDAVTRELASEDSPGLSMLSPSAKSPPETQPRPPTRYQSPVTVLAEERKRTNEKAPGK